MVVLYWSEMIRTDLLFDLDRLDEDLFGEGERKSEDNVAQDEDFSETSDMDEEFEEQAGEDDDDESDEKDEEDEDQIESEVEDVAAFDSADEDDLAKTSAPPLLKDLARSSIDEQERSTQMLSSTGLSDVPGSKTSTRYVPPALRESSTSSIKPFGAERDVEDPRLKRLLLGILNRLSPTSFTTLVLNPADPNSLHSIYLSHSRATTTTLLITLILEIITAQGDGIGDMQVIVLSALIKVLSTGLLGGMAASGGKDLAASLVDSVIAKIDAATGSESIIKERLNLVGFLAMLYNFQVIACVLVYDLIKERIGKSMDEQDVEALLRILKGRFLRLIGY